MRILETNKNIKQKIIKGAIEILAGGGIIVYPTETCYGVGVDATNKQAVDKLLKYKRRREGKAISIAVSDLNMADRYVKVNKTARNLYKNFLPGPLTVISKSKGKVASGLEAEDGTLGVRIPDYPLILDVIRAFGKPITATSANAAYKKTPYCIDDILNNTTKKQQKLLDLVLDAGELPKNPPSTVVDTTMDDIQVLREGVADLLKAQSSKLKTQNYISDSEKQTIQIAKKITNGLQNKLKDNCIIFALQGELGVGKTQFAKGIAKDLRIKDKIMSPTYMLLREYDFKLKTQNSKLKTTSQNSKLNSYNVHYSLPITYHLYHIDTWRMKSPDELLDLKFYKMLKPGNVIIIEWLQKVKKLLEEMGRKKKIYIVWVEMEYVGKETRAINIYYSDT
jgi:L-threonylcarbamoyladenylate synthase